MRDRQSKREAVQVRDQWIENHSLHLSHLSADQIREMTPDLVELLHTSVATHGEAISELAQRLAKSGESLADVVHAVHQRRATDQVSIANVVTSMRLLSALDWVVFFERHSLAEHRLRKDPSGVYPRLDFQSRDRYRHVVERLAKGSRKSDVEVAVTALKLAQDAHSRPDADPRQTQVGYWLQDQGEWQLADCLGYRARWNERVRRKALRRPSLVYSD
jgi:cyclic beta-1,2-glucan synthetase